MQVVNSIKKCFGYSDKPIEKQADDLIKIKSVYSRIASSYLVKVLTVSTVFQIAATVTAGSVGAAIIPSALVLMALGWGINRKAMLQYEFVKRMVYEVSIIPTALKKSTETFGDVILDKKLTIHPIPLKNKGEHEKLKKQGVTCVITTLEEFEYRTASVLSDPMTPEEWKKMGVENKVIHTPDFIGMKRKAIEEGVEKMRSVIQKGGHVSVHCKAAKGRSATLVICYLLKYGKDHRVDLNNDVDAGIKFVHKLHKININADQKQAIVNYLNEYVLRKN